MSIRLFNQSEYLNQIIDNIWMVGRGLTEWRFRLPDLILLNFLLWTMDTQRVLSVMHIIHHQWCILYIVSDAYCGKLTNKMLFNTNMKHGRSIYLKKYVDLWWLAMFYYFQQMYKFIQSIRLSFCKTFYMPSQNSV